MIECAACPSHDTLRQLLDGRLSTGRAEFVAAHLEACPVCTGTVAAFDTGLAGELRTAVEDTGESAPAAPALVARLKGLWAGRDATAADRVAAEFLAPPERPDELGRLGHYRVTRHLGTGGMGVVFAADDTRLNRPVAVKFLHPRLYSDPDARARFTAEARATAAVRHERVVTVFEVGGEDALPYLVMELLDGESLDARVRRDGRLPVADAVRIGREVAEGLAAAHAAGLLHRDVKPANVWLEAQTGRVRLLDFGLARPGTRDARLTDTGHVLGTPGFMAPEQAAGSPTDARADLFGLGCVLHLMTAGEVPFPGPNPMAVLNALASRIPPSVRAANPAVPPLLAGLVARLLEKDPARRPASAAEVVEELRAVERGGPAPVRRSRAAVCAGLGVLAAAVALAAGVVIVITPKEGKPIEIVVPDDAKIEIVQTPTPKAEPVKPIPRVPARSPLDGLRREDIPPDELAAAGNGDTLKAAPELVAVLGSSRFGTWGVQQWPVAYNPAGDRIAGSDGGAKVWDAATGELKERLRGAGASGHTAVAYSPDGKWLAHSRYVGQPLSRYTDISLAHQMTGEARTIRAHGSDILWLEFTPDGRSLASGGRMGT